jgi:hypothetical protein
MSPLTLESWFFTTSEIHAAPSLKLPAAVKKTQCSIHSSISLISLALSVHRIDSLRLEQQ